MRVEIIFLSSSTPKVLDAYSVYTKGGLLCLMLTDRETLVKYPLSNIFSVVHKHQKHGGSSPSSKEPI